MAEKKDGLLDDTEHLKNLDALGVTLPAHREGMLEIWKIFEDTSGLRFPQPDEKIEDHVNVRREAKAMQGKKLEDIVDRLVKEEGMDPTLLVSAVLATPENGVLNFAWLSPVPIRRAVELGGDPTTSRMVGDSGAISVPVVAAAWCEDDFLCEIITSGKVDVTVRGYGGITVLSTLVVREMLDPKACEALPKCIACALDAGADPWQKDDAGSTPLQMLEEAIKQGSVPPYVEPNPANPTGEVAPEVWEAYGKLQVAMARPRKEDGGHNCARCGTAPALLRCSQCAVVQYCEKTCQKKQWKFHKLVCKKLSAS